MLKQLPKGSHFWAKSQGKLVAVIKAKDEGTDDYYFCGEWECSVHESEFEFIELIPFPQGYDSSMLYYQ